MRKLLRTNNLFAPVRSSVPAYNPEANDQKLKTWWTRINGLSNRPASKVYLSQLSNLLAYYNRQVQDTTKVLFSNISADRLRSLEQKNNYQRYRELSQG